MLTSKWQLNVQALRTQIGWLSLAASVVILGGTIYAWPNLQTNGFGGLTLFLSVFSVCILIFKTTEKAEAAPVLGAAY